MTIPTCSTCRFFLPTRGECRRYPPAGDGTFPPTTPGEWCGEHEEPAVHPLDLGKKAAG